MASPEEMYQCQTVNCGYVYDPKLGDSAGGIEPDTPYEDLPENWVCPTCGAKLTQFHRDEPDCTT